MYKGKAHKLPLHTCVCVDRSIEHTYILSLFYSTVKLLLIVCGQTRWPGDTWRLFEMKPT